MTAWTSRSPEGERDMSAIAALFQAIDQTYNLGDPVSVADIQHLLAMPTTVRGSPRIWLAPDGHVVGFSVLAIEPTVDGQEGADVVAGRSKLLVRPDYEGLIEGEMLAHIEPFMTTVATQRGRLGRLSFPIPECMTRKREGVERCGFKPVRHAYGLKRPLEQAIDYYPVPDGFQIRSVRGVSEAETWTESFNRSFRGHWGHQDKSVAFCNDIRMLPEYRSDLDLVATASDGTIAAFCLGTVRGAEDAAGPGMQRGFIQLVGTRPEFRRLGLARALLTEELCRMQAAGLKSATLFVDSMNLTGATALYESVGFQRQLTSTMYQKELPPDASAIHNAQNAGVVLP
ncbi:MAG: GNAT family N-acetyltransferase [Chloroflexota bacterium]